MEGGADSWNMEPGRTMHKSKPATATPSKIVNAVVARKPGVAPSKTHHRPDSPYWSAELLITQHGDDAIGCAEKKMNDYQASGDGDSYLAWGRIYDAIVELQERDG